MHVDAANRQDRYALRADAVAADWSRCRKEDEKLRLEGLRTQFSSTFSSLLSLLRRLLMARFLLLLLASSRIDSLRLFSKEVMRLE